jgi:hypothetical protein
MRSNAQFNARPKVKEPSRLHTSAPWSRAIDTVASIDPESTTIALAGCFWVANRRNTVPSIRASFSVRMTTGTGETLFTGDHQFARGEWPTANAKAVCVLFFEVKLAISDGYPTHSAPLTPMERQQLSVRN